MNILFIDDEDILHETVADFLQRNGYEVTCAFNGKDALDIMVKGSIDLVISDIFLPDYDGIYILRVIKEMEEQIEVILITGQVDIEYAKKALRNGAKDFLLKPLDLTELLTSIETTDAYKRYASGSHTNIREYL